MTVEISGRLAVPRFRSVVSFRPLETPREVAGAFFRAGPFLALFEGRDGFAFIGVDLEEVEQADDLERLHRELRGIHELEGAAALLGDGEQADKRADAARVDHGNVSDVDDDVAIAVAKKVFDGLTKRIDGAADLQVAVQVDDLNFLVLADVDLRDRRPQAP